MTNCLNWPKTTWALVLCPAMVALWWVAGMIVLGSLLFATQPLFHHGPGLSGLFVWPRVTEWRDVTSAKPAPRAMQVERP